MALIFARLRRRPAAAFAALLASAGVLVLFVALGLLATGRNTGQPVFRGRSAGDWALDYTDLRSSPAVRQQAEAALRSMGTNLFDPILRGCREDYFSPLGRMANRTGVDRWLPVRWVRNPHYQLRQAAGALDRRQGEALATFLTSAYVTEPAADPQNRLLNGVADTFFALRRAGVPTSEIVRPWTTNGPVSTRLRALNLIGLQLQELPDRRVAGLRDLLRDPDPAIRLGALAVLNSVLYHRQSGPRTVAIFGEVLRHSDPAIVDLALGLMEMHTEFLAPLTPQIAALATNQSAHQPRAARLLNLVDPPRAMTLGLGRYRPTSPRSRPSRASPPPAKPWPPLSPLSPLSPIP